MVSHLIIFEQKRFSPSHSLEFLFIVRFCLTNLFNRDFLLAKRTRCVIFEPILYAILMKVVFDVTRQCYNALFRFELTKADATLILIGETLWAPLDLEHFV